MGVKVLAGAERGRRLRTPRGVGTRPTRAIVREALFDMLEHRGWVAGRRIVDLFAGSGALGIEALSRGASEVVFVEQVPSVVRVLRANLAMVAGGGRATVLAMPALRALRVLERDGMVADGCMADPPYDAAGVSGLQRALASGSVLTPGGWLALEHAAHAVLPAVPGLEVAVERRYGRTALTVYVREGAAT